MGFGCIPSRDVDRNCILCIFNRWSSRQWHFGGNGDECTSGPIGGGIGVVVAEIQAGVGQSS